ncbi:MAG TPA: tRNA modification GTPase [Candidatus Wujingus californicus]|uniref:tRNA modification GTPase n=1 Tax=Candidatus Wujingus californicus TaxID=3367618 RepID=UPI001DA8AC0B|nr:50S ribosome-binding GTPase [Planctomycetota bacterium]MDO8131554.1 GTPase [Candidatus Brocadiales bacterium]
MLEKRKTDKHARHEIIASIVTPLGEGGIGKIVVSGPDALYIVNNIFEGKKITDLCNAVSNKLYYGYIHINGRKIDEVILNVLKKRDSFTGNDLVEINCHGGIRVVTHIFEYLQAQGVKGTTWESLLSQSFENDKIDFIQKEALQELVQVRTKLGTKVLLDQYAGALSSAIKHKLDIIENIRNSLTNKSVNYKTIIDTEPHEGQKNLSSASVTPIPPPFGHKDEGDFLNKPFLKLIDHINGLLENASIGIALTSPQTLVIVGKPNVGKSTLINAILGEDRMLVHHEPGTTRDYVSEFISVEGIPFELVDTAGIRDTKDRLESISIEMTMEQIKRADKVIAVFDNSRAFDREDDKILIALKSWLQEKSHDCSQQKTGTNTIIPVINKCDLTAKLDGKKIEMEVKQPLCNISAQKKEGLENLNKRLVKEFDTNYKPAMPVIFNKRQYQLLLKVRTLLQVTLSKNKTDEILQTIDEIKGILTACLCGI